VTLDKSPARVLADPSWLLHDVDPDRRRAIFWPTTEQAVRHAAFLDGRTDIWAGSPIELPFEVAVDAPPAGEPPRYLFHMSFCGSTLLARLLDLPGKTLILREPDILVKLADWRTALGRGAARTADFVAMLRFAEAMLFRCWHQSEPVIVKPSSWANNLIDSLIGQGSRAVFITIERAPFVTAVLRGGHDRLAFTARLAAHLAPSIDEGDAWLGKAVNSVDDPLAKAIRLSLVAHEIQHRFFARALERAEGAEIDFDLIESDPGLAALQAAQLLALPIETPDIRANISRWASEHAKGSVAYSVPQRESENAEVRKFHRARIDDALDWARSTFGV
jgi:hypothetical protein